jgi:CDP-diacylglycerol--serine O-phosphatidyltransferase
MKLNYSKSIFANSATAMNAFCGFYSLILTNQNEFILAAIMIYGAAFFDLADGIIARLTKSSSNFGVELDSLADIVSFGVAPSFLIYQIYLINFGLTGLLVSSCVLLCGAFRLARFNVQLDEISTKLDFNGLPVPVVAVTIASLVLFYYNGLNIVEPFASAVIPALLVLSFLMLSNIRYNTVPKVKYLTTTAKILLFTISGISLFVVIITDGVAFFYLVLAHILFGILRYLYFLIFNVNQANELKEKTN